MSVGKSSHVRWFLVFWLFVLSGVAYLDRVNISIAGLSIAAAYHLTNPQLGRVFSAFLAGYAFFQTPGGWLADRLGPRRVLAAGVVWWGIFTALIAIVPSGIGAPLFFFIAARFLRGVGEAVIYPASNQFVSRWIPMQERGIANGLIFAGVGAGAGLSPPLITYVMVHYGWRSSFWVCAIIGLAVGGVWFFAARDTPTEHPRVSATELEIIQSGLTIQTGSAATKQLVPWARVLKSREVWAVTFSYFCYGYVAWIFFSWFYIYLAQARGLNLKTSAFYAMLPLIAMAVFCIAGGKLSDAITRSHGPRIGRCILASIAVIIAGVFVASGSLADTART